MGLFDGAYNQIVGFWAILSIASNNFFPLPKKLDFGVFFIDRLRN